MLIIIKNQQRFKKLNKTKIKKAAQNILSLLEQPTAELSILFVGDKKMHQLNTTYRGVKKATDVLSFPQLSEEEQRSLKKSFPGLTSLRTSELILGDIVINIPKAASRAKTSGTGFYDEVCRLLIHGVLHLLGYNHEKSGYKANVMRKKEEEIFNAIKKMG